MTGIYTNALQFWRYPASGGAACSMALLDTGQVNVYGPLTTDSTLSASGTIAAQNNLTVGQNINVPNMIYVVSTSTQNIGISTSSGTLS